MTRLANYVYYDCDTKRWLMTRVFRRFAITMRFYMFASRYVFLEMCHYVHPDLRVYLCEVILEVILDSAPTDQKPFRVPKLPEFTFAEPGEEEAKGQPPIERRGDAEASYCQNLAFFLFRVRSLGQCSVFNSKVFFVSYAVSPRLLLRCLI